MLSHRRKIPMTTDTVSLCLQSPVGPMGQFLYSVYVHSGPDYPGYKEKSLFYGREVPDRVQVRYAYVVHHVILSSGWPHLVLPQCRERDCFREESRLACADAIASK